MTTYPHNFIGPLRPGDTRAPAPKVFQGPVRPGTDEEYFRRTGRTRSSGGGGGGGSQPTPQQLGPTRADLEAEQQRQAQAKAAAQQAAQQAETQARIEARKTDIIIRAQGGVTKNNITYYGGATVPDTRGQTASQFALQQKNLAISQGIIRKEDLGRVSLRISEPKPTPPPSTTTSANTLDFNKQGVIPFNVDIVTPKSQQNIYSQSYWSSTKESAGNLFSNVKTFFTGKDHKYKDVLAPFDYAGTPKPEQVAVKGVDITYTIPRFGTIAPGESGFETKIIKTEDKTFRQVQAEIETARILYPTETFQDVPDFYTRSGSKVRTIVPTVIDIGITTGLSIAATPLAGTGYMAFRGAQYAAKGKYKDTYSGTELYAGVSEMSPESKQAGLYFGFAAIGAIGQPGRIAKEIDVLRYKEATNAPTKTIGKLYDINNEKWLKTVTRRQTPYYKEQTNIDVPLFMKDNGNFNIGVGQGEQSAKFLPFSQQIGDKGWQIYSKEFVTAGRGTVKPIILNNILLPEKYAVTIGEGYFTLKDTRVTKSFGFGGITKDVGKAYTGKGGKITAQRVYGEVFGNIEVTPTELVIPLKSTAVVPLSDTSIVFKESPKVINDFGLTITKDFSRKSSSSFLSQLYKQENAIDVGSFASSVSRGVGGTYQVVQPSIRSVIIPQVVPTIFSNKETKQIQQPQKDIISFNKQSTLPVVDQYSAQIITPMVIQIPKQSNRLSSKNKAITRQQPVLESLTKNITAQQTGQLTKQKQLTQQKQVFGTAYNFPIRTQFIPTTPPPKIPVIIIPRISKGKATTKMFGGFTVFGRRFGKFKPIGVGRTEREAFSLGKKFASSTLGVTFKVPKSKILKLPGYRTKKTKEGTLFIEPRKRRLKRGSGELPEIQFFKQLKGGKKK